MTVLLSDMLDDLGLDHGTVVVCPSLSFPADELRKITGIQHYEERLLFLLLGLRDPRLRIVYPTSLPVDPAVIDYYLSFLSDRRSARARLELVSVDDGEARALSAKLRERPAAAAHLRSLVGGEQGFVLPFNVTPWEAALAEALGIPLYGARPELTPLGSKSGARRVARAAGVEVPDGAEDLWSVESVERAIAELVSRRQRATRVVVKLNDGFSGQGNAIVETRDGRLPEARTVFCAAEESWPSFARKIASGGAVVEELLSAPDLVSPSVQLWIHTSGEVEVVSTHDQILGGPDDQVYLGCRFPASERYRALIVERARRVGRALSSRGVIGPFGVDFLVSTGSRERILLSEINLRMGGTTHPFGMALLATGGHYDATTGELWAEGRTKCYVATDNLRSRAYVGLTPAEVIEEVRARGLAFEPRVACGVMLHLLGALPRFGKLGATCVGDTVADCDALYRELVAVVGRLGERAGGRRRLT